MVRIRYSTRSGELISKEMESTHGVLRTRISRHGESPAWKVFLEKQTPDGSWQSTSEADLSKTLAVAKAIAKSMLKDHGVHFLDEVRKRK